MANRIKLHDEKCIPGLNFILSIPLNFSISSKESLYTKFNQLITNRVGVKKKELDVSFNLRKIMFDRLKVSDEKDMIYNNRNIKRKINELKSVIKDEMKLNEKFSEFYKRSIEKMINNME